MRDRWRVRRSGLAIAAVIAICAVAAGAMIWTAASMQSGPSLTVLLPDGTVLHRAALGDDGAFTLRYRNSVYGSLAEERFRVEGGRLRLVELAADELAVLEEYYAIDEPARRAEPDDPRAWVAAPARDLALDALTVAATDLGQRTLLAGDATLELWRLVDDGAASIVIEASDP